MLEHTKHAQVHSETIEISTAVVPPNMIRGSIVLTIVRKPTVLLCIVVDTHHVST